MRLLAMLLVAAAGFAAGQLTATREPAVQVTVVGGTRDHLEALCNLRGDFSDNGQLRATIDAEIVATADELNSRHFNIATQNCVAAAGGF